MATNVGRGRRRHSAEFRARVIAACEGSGVSVASVALAHGLNANLLRKWIKAAKGAKPEATRLVVGKLERNLAVPFRIAPAEAEPEADIRLDIRRGGLAVQIAWPREEIEALGRLLEGLLR